METMEQNNGETLEEPSEERKELNALNEKKLKGEITPDEIGRIHEIEESLRRKELDKRS